MIQRELSNKANARALFIIEAEFNREVVKKERVSKIDKIVYVFVELGEGHKAKKTIRFWQDYEKALTLMKDISDGLMFEMKDKDGEYVAVRKHSEYKKTDIAERSLNIEAIKTEKGKVLRFGVNETKEGGEKGKLYFDLPFKTAVEVAYSVHEDLISYKKACWEAEVFKDEIMPYFGIKKNETDNSKSGGYKKKDDREEDDD